ncbi:MAG: FecR family protein [Verrucomicrobiota bacterium]
MGHIFTGKKLLQVSVFTLISLNGTHPCLFAARNLLDEATFTQVVNDVSVIQSVSQRSIKATIRSNVAAPDLVKTGIKSRAELIAEDQTITRIGSNSILSFDKGERGINLQQGSVLFHSPRGRGGGVIRTAGATAAITGTTVAASATSNGGFKLMTLEGKAKATLPNGRSQTVLAGQVTFILPGQNFIPKPLNFDLQRNVDGADLVNGFSQELPSLPKINKEINKQQNLVKTGRAKKSDVKVGDAKTKKSFELVINNTTRESQNEVQSGRRAQGFSKRALIDSPDLDPDRIGVFETGSDIPRIEEFDPGAEFLNETRVTAFFAQDIEVQTGNIDLSKAQQNGTEVFAFLADGKLLFDKGTKLNNYNREVTFASRRDIGSTSSAESGPPKTIKHNGGSGPDVELAFHALDNIDFKNFNFEVNGNLVFESGKNIEIRSTSGVNTLQSTRTNMEANTIILEKVNLIGPGEYVFKTNTGRWVWNAGGILQGGLNLIDVEYNGTALFISPPVPGSTLANPGAPNTLSSSTGVPVFSKPK